MSIVAVIPARYASTRLPGKPLLRDTGKPLIQHVVEQVGGARCFDRVVVATDDARIAEVVNCFGGEAVMTRTDHASGTSRVAEAARNLGLKPQDWVVNVQGDEPEIDRGALARLCNAAATWTGKQTILTLAAPFPAEGPSAGPHSPLDPNRVKVVVGTDGRAIYFSRSLIPYPRAARGVVVNPSDWLLHLGIYAYQVETLFRLTDRAKMLQGRLSAMESLEQLEWLENEWAVRVVLADFGHPGVDTPDDYAAFVERVRRRGSRDSQGDGARS